MNGEKVKSILIEEFSSHLDVYGFTSKDESSGLSFIRDLNSRVEHIFLNLSDYGNKHNVYPPGCGIRISKVEEIRSNVLHQDDAENMVTLLPYKEYDGGMDDSLPGPLDYVENEDDLRKTAKTLKTYTDKYILPFFSRYPTLKEADAKIQQIPVVELHEFIGQEVVGRRMIIMKLAGNPGYEEYVNMLLDYFIGEAKKGNQEAKSDLAKYSELNEYLVNADGVE